MKAGKTTELEKWRVGELERDCFFVAMTFIFPISSILFQN